MIILPTPEIVEMKKKIEPYMEGCHLRPDTPEEIVKMDQKVRNWYKDIFDRAFEAGLM